MSNSLYAQLGFSFISQASKTYSAFSTANIQASMQRAAQAHHNTMLQLSGAQAQNRVTLNEIAARDSAMEQHVDQQVAALREQGAAAVAAGAAGVAGNSVTLASRALSASHARANKSRIDSLRSQMQAFGAERRNIDISTALGQSTQYILRPSAGDLAIGLLTDAGRTVQEYSGEGRVADFLGGLVGSSRGSQSSLYRSLQAMSGISSGLSGAFTHKIPTGLN